MQLTNFDYHSDHEGQFPGLAGVANDLKSARDTSDNSLLFDNGDFFQGNLISDWWARRDKPHDKIHPAVEIMNMMGFDGATLGNHDFDYGLDTLRSCLNNANFPWVVTNLCSAEGRELGLPLARTALLNRQIRTECGQLVPFKIGVLGLSPVDSAKWGGLEVSNICHFERFEKSILFHTQTLQIQGADLIVLLAHSGTSGHETEGNALQSLARRAGISAVIAGHEHKVFAENVNGPTAPIVMAGHKGSHFAQIDLHLVKSPGSDWLVQSSAGKAVATTDNAAPAANIAFKLATTHDAVRRFANTPIGETDQPIHTYFSAVKPDRFFCLMSSLQRAWAQSVVDGNPDLQSLPAVYVSCPFNSGFNSGPQGFVKISKGRVLRRHIAALYRFPNKPCLIKTTGPALLDWMEQAAGVFRTLPIPAQDAPLFRRDTPLYRFDMFGGASYEIDPAASAKFDALGNAINPESQRIKNAQISGSPIENHDHVLVVTNHFRFGGGGAIPRMDQAKLIKTSAQSYADHLETFLSGPHTIDPCFADTWKFSAKEQSTAIFETSPDAVNYLGDIEHLMPEFLGIDGDGFARIRISL